MLTNHVLGSKKNDSSLKFRLIFWLQVSDKDLFVFADDCVSQRCSKSDACDDFKCRICKHCLADDELDFIRRAYLVNTWIINFRSQTRTTNFFFIDCNIMTWQFLATSYLKEKKNLWLKSYKLKSCVLSLSIFTHLSTCIPNK